MTPSYILLQSLITATKHIYSKKSPIFATTATLIEQEMFVSSGI